MSQIVKLRRVGDSTVMTIPKPILADLSWEQGEQVILYVGTDGRLHVELDQR